MRSDPDLSQPALAIRRYVMMVALGLALASAWHAALDAFGLQFPYNTFLFKPQDSHNDWHNMVRVASTLDPYGYAAAYFPFAFIAFLSGAGLGRWASYAVFALAGIGGFVAGIWLYCRQQRAIIPFAPTTRLDWLLMLAGTVLSHPFLFALDRGNLDLWVGALCLLFVALLGSRLEIGGYVALALAIAMKGYPAAFLALPLIERRYRAIVLCMLLVLVLTIVPMHFFGDGLIYNYLGMQNGMRVFQQNFVIDTYSTGFSSDPYNALRVSIFALVSLWNKAHVAEPSLLLDEMDLRWYFFRLYQWIIMVAGAFMVFFVLAVRAENWRRMIVLCVFTIIYPHVANDYKVVIMVPAILATLTQADGSRRSNLAIVLLALLMMPKSYLIVSRHSTQIIINAVLLVWLSVLVMRDRRAWRRAWRLLPHRLRWYAAPVVNALRARRGHAPFSPAATRPRHQHLFDLR